MAVKSSSVGKSFGSLFLYRWNQSFIGSRQQSMSMLVYMASASDARSEVNNGSSPTLSSSLLMSWKSLM
eukprot:9628265-Ditylum_brightwellii.AAC.1